MFRNTPFVQFTLHNLLKTALLPVIAFALSASFMSIACTPDQFFALMDNLEKQEAAAEAARVEIFVEDSLLPAINAVAEEFRKIRPECQIILEPSSSKMAVRKIVDMGRVPDILITRGIYLIQTEGITPDYSPFFIQFARDRLVIAFTDASTGGSGITETAWPAMLSQKKARFGRVSRDSDPLGVYTDFMASLMTAMKLWPAEVSPEIWAKSFSRDQNRVDPLDLVRQLETGNMDYAFIYSSLAQSHRLKTLELPSPANLGVESLSWKEGRDGSVDLSVAGRRFRVPASPIYAVACVMSESAHPKSSAAFIRYLVGDGQKHLAAGNLIPYTIEGLVEQKTAQQSSQQPEQQAAAADSSSVKSRPELVDQK
ncbi:MAG: hypothetical protein CVV64_10910 [Candidatus Wallbacteria bacterium HGW-Wallbacteria-1]|jgi:molybdate/tungstate transport system substrate-binding protein|uniref:PBP domain-containing protein n=1 Tax=Candidatus Wallbacteria bacterium HGW-Wallbacteria-1 TaxID=2013854 RepID=A0A2N1PPG5_9BACT|nr:MAG: hypothetical protein CVV64_10910 [Candidatus Wallbacteria bacterium HGW-Wallbacteria-1]